jgi:hypothetical protein
LWDSSINTLTTVKSRRPRNCGLIPSKGKRKGPTSHMAYPAFFQCIPQGPSQIIEQTYRENNDIPLSNASLRTNGHTTTFLQVSSDCARDNFACYRNQHFNFTQLAVTSSIFIHTLLNMPITNTSYTRHSIKVRDKVSLLRKMTGVIRFHCVFRQARGK